MDYIGPIRAFIVENFFFGEDKDWLGDETSFLESGVIDSTGILEIITFIEEKFDIHVEDDEIVPENLDSLKNLAAFLARKNGRLDRKIP